MFFFFNDTATTEIYTLSLHDALPILLRARPRTVRRRRVRRGGEGAEHRGEAGEGALALRGNGALLLRQRGSGDRKSTRLNSSHANISYAVFCLKKKKLYSFMTQHQ